eukprot:9482832-Pyramimonas_sp.AAC.1
MRSRAIVAVGRPPGGGGTGGRDCFGVARCLVKFGVGRTSKPKCTRCLRNGSGSDASVHELFGDLGLRRLLQALLGEKRRIHIL